MIENQGEPRFIARYRDKDRKPQCLWRHLKSVSDQAGKFGQNVGLEKTCRLIGLAHDIGKNTDEFRDYLKHATGLIEELSFQVKGSKLDHATAGAQILYEAFLSHDGKTTFLADILAMTVAAHHGFMDALTPDGKDALANRLSKNESATRKLQALSSLPPDITQSVKELFDSGVDEELRNFLI